MRIPVESEPAESFIIRATDVIKRCDTHLYVDTSLLMWLTAIGSESRQAFIDWTRSIHGRIHVPAWACHEFFRHHDNKTQVKGIDLKGNALEAALNDFSAHVRVYADGSLSSDQTTMDLLLQLEVLRREATRAVGLARAWDYDGAVRDVIEWINPRAMSGSSIFSAFDALDRTGDARYSHRVPPGFRDEKKEENRFGDLLFWNDVVDHARARRAKTAVVLTRDRKKDWFFSTGRDASVGIDLRRLRGTWDPVPVPHPMLTFEIATRSMADLLLLDELYLGAVLWSQDRQRYGRFAAVAIGMSLDRLREENAPPDDAATRARRRAADDVISLAVAKSLVDVAIKAEESEELLRLLAGLTGQAPEVEAFIQGFTVDKVEAIDAGTIATLARRVYEMASDPMSADAVFARRLLDSVDRLKSRHASAVVVGMLVGAYFDGEIPRERPTGILLQDVFEWQADAGVGRALDLVAKRLRDRRSTALYIPSAKQEPVEINIKGSNSNDAVPAAIGQIYYSGRALLTSNAIEDEFGLSTILGGTTEATVGDVLDALGRYYGLPVRQMSLVGVGREYPRTILATTGLERFSPRREFKQDQDLEAQEPLVIDTPEELFGVGATSKEEDEDADEDWDEGDEDDDH